MEDRIIATVSVLASECMSTSTEKGGRKEKGVLYSACGLGGGCLSRGPMWMWMDGFG